MTYETEDQAELLHFEQIAMAHVPWAYPPNGAIEADGRMVLYWSCAAPGDHWNRRLFLSVGERNEWRVGPWLDDSTMISESDAKGVMFGHISSLRSSLRGQDAQ